jgi:enamine deaminase RidA (YjgF/YER057c/UK114 family)
LSRAVVANGFVFLAGLTARNKEGDVRRQTSDILEQIETLLKEAGSNKSKLVSANVWLTDVADFDEMNLAWEAWIDPRNPPARATVQAQLAGSGSLVEIKAMALA